MALNPNQIDLSNQIQQGIFRNAAAGLIKSIVRARATEEPKFLSAKDYKRWGVTGLASENRSSARILTHVRQLRERFEEQFLGNLGSVSEPELLDDIDDIEILANE